LQRPRLLVVASDPTWTSDATAWLAGQGYSCLGASSTAEAEALMALLAPDVVVVDLTARVDDPLAFVLQVASSGHTQVVLVGGQAAAPLTITAVHPDGDGPWPDAPTPHLATLRQALERVAPVRSSPAPAIEPLLPVLTPRERDLVACLAEGLHNQAIAERLAISEKTVRNLLTKLYGKLAVSSRTQALILLQQNGAVPRLPGR
jgi:DNA-binding NarL/FixJ family response regulator